MKDKTGQSCLYVVMIFHMGKPLFFLQQERLKNSTKKKKSTTAFLIEFAFILKFSLRKARWSWSISFHYTQHMGSNSIYPVNCVSSGNNNSGIY